MSKIATQFTAAVQNAGIYPDDHPQVRSYIQETYRLLEELFEWKKAMTLLLIGDSLMVDKKPLTIAGACETALVQILRDHAIERVTFSRGLSLAELVEFIRALSPGGVSARRSIPHIKFGKLESKDRDDREGDDSSDTEDRPRPMTWRFRPRRSGSRTSTGTPRAGEKSIRRMQTRLSVILRTISSREANPLRLLAETKSNDEYTFTHTANVGILTLFLAQHLGFNGSVLNNIGVAAILHDVGKVTTPDEILSKPGPLTPDERAVMETHSMKGALNLMEQANITNVAVLGAMEHHMKYDGTGYPRVKGGGEQSIVGQMICVADVYDALRTIRPYRPTPMPMDRIIQIFKKDSGTAFNPYLVERFLTLIDK